MTIYKILIIMALIGLVFSTFIGNVPHIIMNGFLLLFWQRQAGGL